MMLLTEAQFDRLPPEDKIDYVAEHGKNFELEQAVETNPSAPSKSFIGHMIDEIKIEARDIEMEKIRVAEETNDKQAKVIRLRTLGYYRSFRSLLDFAVGISTVIFICMVLRGFFLYGHDQPLPFLEIFISFWGWLWILIMRFAGNILADLADHKMLEK